MWMLYKEAPSLDCSFLTLNYTSAHNNSTGLAVWRDKLCTVAHVAVGAARQTLGASPAIAKADLQHQNPTALSPLPLFSMSSYLIWICPYRNKWRLPRHFIKSTQQPH